MIYTERKVTVKNDASIVDSPILLFRGDRNVEILFTIIDSKFRFEGNKGNVIDKTKASHGQLAVALPNGTDLFTDVAECKDGTVTFTITGEMIDEIGEVGFYSFHIRLFNEDKTARVTLPAVMKGIEIREPLVIEMGDPENIVNSAMVGYSMAQPNEINETIPDTFDEEGQYNKTDWKSGDVLSKGKLNKIEDAIFTINKNEMDNYAALNSRIDNIVPGVNGDVNVNLDGLATKEELNNKVDKVDGKGLSTNDYTTEEKDKLSGIEENANNYIHPKKHNVDMIEGLSTVSTTGDYNDLINKPAIPSIDGLATENYVDIAIANAQLSGGDGEINLDGFATKDELNAKVDKVDGKGLSTNDYTTEEKDKLSGIEENANNYIHPKKHNVDMIEGLSDIAISGSYNDLTDKPAIPSIDGLATEQYVNDAIAELKEEGGNENSDIDEEVIEARGEEASLNARLVKIENDVVDNETLLNKKMYYFDKVSDMKAATFLKTGDMVVTLGYFSVDDGGGAKYLITELNDAEDLGSIISVSNNLKAKLLVGNGVDCRLFGCGNKTLSQAEITQRFDNWLNYVNNTKGKYFAPTGGESFILYKPLLLKKSIIGVNKPVFTFATTIVGKQVVSTTEKTDDNRSDFNKNAVIAVKSVETNESDRIRVENLVINCTNADDGTSASQDYGLYIPSISNFEIKDIFITRPDQAGLKLEVAWMGNISFVNVWQSRKAGYELKGTFTSLHVSNCYAHGYNTKGWDINGAVYSNFESIASDTSTHATASYSIASCWGVNFSGLGSEGGTRDYIFYMGDFTGTINGVFLDGPTIKNAILFNYAPSKFSFDGLGYRNLKRVSGASPHSFHITSSNASQKITLNLDSETVPVTDGYEMKITTTDKAGTLVVNHDNNSYTVRAGVKNFVNESPTVIDFGHKSAELVPTDIAPLVGNVANKPCYYRYTTGIHLINGSYMYSDGKYYVSEYMFDLNYDNVLKVRKWDRNSNAYTAWKSVQANA